MYIHVMYVQCTIGTCTSYIYQWYVIHTYMYVPIGMYVMYFSHVARLQTPLPLSLLSRLPSLLLARRGRRQRREPPLGSQPRQPALNRGPVGHVFRVTTAAAIVAIVYLLARLGHPRLRRLPQCVLLVL